MYPSSDQLSCLSCTYGCIFCTSLAACSACMTGYLPSGALCVCDSVNNYFMGDISGSCEKCALVGCLTCFNLVTCTTCDLANNYFPSTGVLTTNLCIKCTLIGCLTCSSLTTCSLCDSNIGYGSDPSNIIQCLPCNQSCTCGGWYPPIQNGICTRSLFCGDGWVGWN